MQLNANEIHIWSASLTLSPDEEQQKRLLLSTDELARADRFKFPIHRIRYTAARANLRNILSQYLKIEPAEFVFHYNEYDKPFLNASLPNKIEFNLSHSDDKALYAFSTHGKIGIDIEKINSNYNQDVAKRFFSKHEYFDLLNLPLEHQKEAFFRIWTRKEALIKAAGRGLSIPLADFSVSVKDSSETIHFDAEAWSLISLPLVTDYQAALAINQKINTIYHWKYFDQGKELIKIYHLDHFI